MAIADVNVLVIRSNAKAAMAQPNKAIQYRPMSLDRHKAGDVACLLYESAPDLFALMFGSRAIAILTALVQRSHNRFSHQYIRVAECEQQVVGIVTLVPAADVKAAADYGEILNLSQTLWLKLLQAIVLRHVLQHDYSVDTFYLGNLAVAEAYRNQGIGHQLLAQCMATAERRAAGETTASTLFISVDMHNVRAQKLYESLGFQVVAKKTIGLFGITIGSHILSLSVPDQVR